MCLKSTVSFFEPSEALAKRTEAKLLRQAFQLKEKRKEKNELDNTLTLKKKA